MKLEKSDRFLELILSSVADGVFTVDKEKRVTSFNRAAARITGVASENAIGKHCYEVLRADACERDCALRRTMDTGREQIDVSAKILDAKGRSIPISLSVAVLRDSDGTLLGAVETFRDLSTIERLRREITRRYTFEDIVGKSKAFRNIFAILPDIAKSDSTVLIEGPSGSGKELVSRALHNLSSRRKQPYVALNCGALPANLFESEFFGYMKGAFTDAKKDKPGRLALAERGTIFFDEISELPLSAQVKLLRVIQEREYEPLGSTKTVRANVRIVASTNKKLVDLVIQEKFRDDLYFRLAVARLSLPPLKERREDIPPLIEHFIQRFNARYRKNIKGVAPAAMKILMRYDFPGNVRELENFIEHGFILCHNAMIDARHLPEDIQSMQKPGSAKTESRLKWAEADIIRSALQRNSGHLGQTASDLKISRITLWRKMKKFEIFACEYRLQDKRSSVFQ